MERIYLDTNAFYFFFFEHEKYTRGITKVFGDIQEGSCTGVTTSFTLEELAYIVLMRLIEKRYERHPSDVLREDRTVVRQLAGRVQAIFDVIYSLQNLEIVEVDRNRVGGIPMTMERTCLLPGDCVHLMAMASSDCTRILSTDTDFDAVEGIERIEPESVRPQ